MTDTLVFQESLVESIKSTVWKAGNKNNELTAKLNQISDDETMKSIKESTDTVTKISEDMIQVKEEAANMNKDIFELKVKLANLEPDWDSKFGLAEENISQSMSTIKMANDTLLSVESVVKQQNEKFRAWNSTFSANLQALKDKIARAKHAADGVSFKF